MAIDSEEELARFSGDGRTELLVRLDFDGFAVPEVYDPTTPPTTNAGQKRLETLVGVSVEGTTGTGGAHVDVTYDHETPAVRASEGDGTAAPGAWSVYLRLTGNPAP
ncbi:hypothetical protein OSG_eHP31_00015 [environmental Halophage eHP-31]|nr:hypothetical protein OSG_eHP31_00015 [environmental Halophage eHP-31]